MAVSRFPLRARVEFSIPVSHFGQRGITPAFGYDALHPSAGGTQTLPINALPGAHYVEDLTPGEWEVRAQLPTRGLEARAATVLPAGVEEVSLDLEFPTGGLTLSGVVFFEDERVPAAAVTLEAVESEFKRDVRTDHRGRFRFGGIEPGHYRLTGSGPGLSNLTSGEFLLTNDRDLVLRIGLLGLVTLE